MKPLLLVAGLAALGSTSQIPADGWLTWPAARAEGIGKAAYVQGRVGGFFDTRILSTDRSYNYKLAATWMHADVVRAAARMAQLTERMSDDAAKKLVAEATSAGDTVLMVEIDPREGSGVIPMDWLAVLQPIMPGGAAGRPVRGMANPKLRDVKALTGVLRRNYDYDRFWLVFPWRHEDQSLVLPGAATHAELVVRIAGKEGRVRWVIPETVKAQLLALTPDLK